MTIYHWGRLNHHTMINHVFDELSGIKDYRGSYNFGIEISEWSIKLYWRIIFAFYQSSWNLLFGKFQSQLDSKWTQIQNFHRQLLDLMKRWLLCFIKSTKLTHEIWKVDFEDFRMPNTSRNYSRRIREAFIFWHFISALAYLIHEVFLQ